MVGKSPRGPGKGPKKNPSSFFTVLPNGLTARSYVHVALYQGVTNLWAVAHTWPLFFTPHPWKRWSLTSTVTPYAPYSTRSLASVQSPYPTIASVILLSVEQSHSHAHVPGFHLDRSTVILRLTKVIRSGITFVSRNFSLSRT